MIKLLGHLTADLKKTLKKFFFQVLFSESAFLFFIYLLFFMFYTAIKNTFGCFCFCLNVQLFSCWDFCFCNFYTFYII